MSENNREKLKDVITPFANFVTSKLPSNGSTQEAIKRLQETIWWCEKSYIDEELKLANQQKQEAVPSPS